MPFGETLPLRSILKAVIPENLLFNDFETGTHNIDINLAGHHIRPLICLEGIYGSFYRSNTHSIIAILANNAWFNNSSAGNKLRKFAQVYAAEYQTTVLLAANFGESAIISPTGFPTRLANHPHSQRLTAPIPFTTKPSFFHHWPWLGTLLILVGWTAMIRRLRIPLSPSIMKSCPPKN